MELHTLCMYCTFCTEAARDESEKPIFVSGATKEEATLKGKRYQS